MPGVLYRSRDGLSEFEEGPQLFNPGMRHSAILRRGQRLYVFWTARGDAPERIWVSTIDMAGNWMSWRESAPVEVLRALTPLSVKTHVHAACATSSRARTSVMTRW